MKLVQGKGLPVWVALMIGMIGVVGLAGPASADDIDGAVTAVEVEQTSVKWWEAVTVNVSWQIDDDSAQAGDTFTLSLPEQLRNFPSSTIELLDEEGSGEVVAVAEIDGGDPSTATFTLTEFVENHVGVSGEAYFSGYFADASYADTTQPLSFTANDGRTFDDSIDVDPGITPDRAEARKYGVFTDPRDECRTAVDDCMRWYVESATGPFDEVTIVDTPAAGVVFSCDQAQVLVGTPGNYRPAENPVVSCSESELSATVTDVAAGELVRVVAVTSAVEPATDAGAVYENTVAVTVTKDYQEQTDEITRKLRSSDLGGQGRGTQAGIEIVKGDEDGNAADTAEERADLGSGEGSTGLVYTVTNTGPDTLTGIEVSDEVISNGEIVDFACAFPDDTTGVNWDGPFGSGESFDCTAELTGVHPGEVHENIATVTGTWSAPAPEGGTPSSGTVSDDDPYFAETTEDSTEPVRVGDYVWIDDDRDGVQDEGETAIPDVTLTLTDADGETVADADGNEVDATSTDADGYYVFENLPPGEYVVTIDASTVPDGHVPTEPNVGDRADDSDTGSARSLELAAGEEDMTLDFGWVVEETPPTPGGEPEPEEGGGPGLLPNTGAPGGSWWLAGAAAGLIIAGTALTWRLRRTA